jgi:hypothetical protein
MGGRVVALTHLMAVFVPLCGWTVYLSTLNPASIAHEEQAHSRTNLSYYQHL